MPEIDFPNIEDHEEYPILPDGTYLCCLTKIDDTRKTNNGNEMWGLTFTVLEDGEYIGQKIFDNMPFSQAALKRVKLICSALGLPTDKAMDIKPDSILEKKVFIDTTIEIFEHNGKMRKKNVIPFAGYHRVKSNGMEEEDVPF